MRVIEEEELQRLRQIPFWKAAVEREMERPGAGILFLVQKYNEFHAKKISPLRLVGGTDVETA